MIINGDSAIELKKFKDNSIDAVITDPPYGIEFLAKEWDNNTGAVEIWQECLRVLKPGGHLLAFSAARTYHILATNIQASGFEIRDQIMWLYASGFPKAQDIGKAIEKREGKRQTQTTVDIRPEYSVHPKSSCPKCQLTGNGTNWQKCVDSECPQKNPPADNEWAGWKTALKPAHEPICMARKPMKGSTIDNVQKHGVGALNIDATRIPFETKQVMEQYNKQRQANINQPPNPRKTCLGSFAEKTDKPQAIKKGKDPRNRLIELDGSKVPTKPGEDEEWVANDKGRFPSNVIGEVEGYQKFFYCPKVSRKERHRGFENPGPQTFRERDENGKCLPYAEKIDGVSPTMLAERFDKINKDPLSHIKKGDNFSAALKGDAEMWGKYNKQDPLSHIKKGDNFGDGLATAGALHKDRDPLSHIEKLSNYSQGDVKNHPLWDKSIGTNLQRLKHKIMEHNKDVGPKLDPLSHIPTNPEGMWDDSVQFQKRKQDPLSHIPVTYTSDHGPIKHKASESNRKLGNNHPTVKPVALMKYLIKLVAPKNSHILDPFMGSGTTGMAAKELGITFTGIEMDKSYCDIAKRRIDASKVDQFNKLFDKQ